MQAIKEAFGVHASRLAVCSTRSMHGHLVSVVLLAAWVALVPRVGEGQMPEGPGRVRPLEAVVAPATEVADSLFMTMDPGSAMAVLSARLEVAPDDFEALWRGTRAGLALGILTENRDEKLKWLRAAEGHANRLLALGPDDPVALTWAAAVKGRLAMDDHNPVTTARLGKEVWELTGALLAAEPDNPMGNDIRGKLIQEVRKLSWGERILARLLLGSDVVSAAHWDDSERYLERAVEGDPLMVVYYLDLGDTYRLQGMDAEALDAYRRGLAPPNRYPVDEYYKRQIRNRVRALEQEKEAREP